MFHTCFLKLRFKEDLEPNITNYRVYSWLQSLKATTCREYQLQIAKRNYAKNLNRCDSGNVCLHYTNNFCLKCRINYSIFMGSRNMNFTMSSYSDNFQRKPSFIVAVKLCSCRPCRAFSTTVRIGRRFSIQRFGRNDGWGYLQQLMWADIYWQSKEHSQHKQSIIITNEPEL